MYLIADKNIKSLSADIDDYPEGIVIPIDKPYRWTSADVIRKVKFAACRHFQKKNLKVGHAGTLDPLATGMLLVCIGKATKQAEALQRHDKEYLARVAFGATTPSFDLEKEVDKLYPTDSVSESIVRSVLPSFLGEQEQIAPLFSAKSVDGVRAYELARKMMKESALSGVVFDHAAAEILNRQSINIIEIELLEYSEGRDRLEELSFGAMQMTAESDNPKCNRIHVADTSSLCLPEAEIRIVCSKGTYIRAFARDLGESLNTGAHLSALRRTRSGEFKVNSALSVSEAIELLK